ncbi:MAG: hypothetical protein MUP30_10145 [Deltaproteobacteria bacterium]|nr:hypothetical protein [Deltaproteobacteria bacterium]
MRFSVALPVSVPRHPYGYIVAIGPLAKGSPSALTKGSLAKGPPSASAVERERPPTIRIFLLRGCRKATHPAKE